MLKTKIICTMGPAVDSPEKMRQLVASGMDVARLNFSHGTQAEHLERVRQFRAVCEEMRAVIPIMLDTKGPEIRLGVFPEKEAEIAEGQDYILTTEAVDCDHTRASISYPGLPQDLSPGNMILIDDGLVELQVQSVSGPEIRCKALNGGVLSSWKSLNVPDITLNLPSFTEQDRSDILFAIAHDFDFIAVSFVRKKEDITEIARILEENNGREIKLIAKIENREGVNNLDEIIRVSDGLMVARGDLGVELPVEEIPMVQKDMILRCYRASKPVITATQMLDSMIRNPRPTRAEVTDVANAVYDGTSAIMLSGETAAGKYPIEALQTMKRIADTAEKSFDYWKNFRRHETWSVNSITNAISHATCTTAMDLNASAVVAVTISGATARRVSGFRPACPIVAATTSKKTQRQLRMSWGVYPMLVDVVSATDDLFTSAAEAARASGLAQDGDIVVVTAGVPLDTVGTTNMLKVQMIGNVLCRGKGIGGSSATGPLCVLRHDEDQPSFFLRHSILVIDEVSDAILPLIRQSAAVILEGADWEGKAATLALTLEIPVITDCDGATKILKSGTVVTVDAKKGTVKCVE